MAQTKEKTSSVRTVPPVGCVGRRKRAIARVWLRKGKGTLIINGRPCEGYFTSKETQSMARASLILCNADTLYDVQANVCGGGMHSQATAIRLGVARALATMGDDLKKLLLAKGFLTVDSRNKERKKPGQPGARRKFQFVKR